MEIVSNWLCYAIANPLESHCPKNWQMNLEYTRLWIMQELWLDQHQADRGRTGLTAEQLAERIRATTGSITTNSVRTAANELIKEFAPPLLTVLESLHQTRAGRHDKLDPRRRGGLAPRAFKIDQEVVITWPCTAKLVLNLHAKSDSRWPQAALVEEICNAGVTDPDTGKLFTTTKILDGVRFAIDHGYIRHVQGDTSLVTTTDKVAVIEKLYLEFLASHT